jgi:acyl-CoA reductase-like NAD-dependent aldehyde dehydrogenase
MTTFEAVGLPRGVIQVIHADMQVTAKLAADARIGFLAFTGSVAGGRILAKAAADGEGFKGVGLELGGKDPAYVRSDVDVKWAAAELVDGEYIPIRLDQWPTLTSHNQQERCSTPDNLVVQSSVSTCTRLYTINLSKNSPMW